MSGSIGSQPVADLLSTFHVHSNGSGMIGGSGNSGGEHRPVLIMTSIGAPPLGGIAVLGQRVSEEHLSPLPSGIPVELRWGQVVLDKRGNSSAQGFRVQIIQPLLVPVFSVTTLSKQGIHCSEHEGWKYSTHSEEVTQVVPDLSPFPLSSEQTVVFLELLQLQEMGPATRYIVLGEPT